MIIDQRDSGPVTPLGAWTGLVVIDDRSHAIRASGAAHRRRWVSWLHWGNLLQFLEVPGADGRPGGNGRQLAHSGLSQFDSLALAAGELPEPGGGNAIRNGEMARARPA